MIILVMFLYEKEKNSENKIIQGAALMGGGDDHRVGCSPSPTQDASTSVIYEAPPGYLCAGWLS
jgi:hypothetical protein